MSLARSSFLAVVPCLLVLACGGQDSYGAPGAKTPVLVIGEEEVPVLIHPSSPPVIADEKRAPLGPSPARLVALVFSEVSGCHLNSAHISAPASVAWLNADGEVVAVQDLAPDAGQKIEPPQFCPYALIAVQGWFDERDVWRGVEVGIPEETQRLLTVTDALNQL